MKVTQEKLPDSQIALEIEIPAEISQKIYNTTLQSFARTANIPGFRKGKVPRPVLLQRLGSNLTAATLEDAIKSTLNDAIEQEKFLILPHPQVAEFEQRKAADRDRWLSGMRKLQARVYGKG